MITPLIVPMQIMLEVELILHIAVISVLFL